LKDDGDWGHLYIEHDQEETFGAVFFHADSMSVPKQTLGGHVRVIAVPAQRDRGLGYIVGCGRIAGGRPVPRQGDENGVEVSTNLN